MGRCCKGVKKILMPCSILKKTLAISFKKKASQVMATVTDKHGSQYKKVICYKAGIAIASH